MSIIDVWGNSFIPLLAGIPLLIFILFAICACIDKTCTAVKKTYYYRPRTPRRVRFDCETPIRRNTTSPPYSRVSRSSTSPRLSGLMAHSSYVQRNSNYRYNSVVHVDRSAMPLQTRTILEREGIGSSSANRDLQHHQHNHHISHQYPDPPPQTPGPGANFSSVFNYPGSRRSSTPTPTGPSSAYYSMRPKSPFESCGTHLEPKQRRYSTPSSPTMYAYTHHPSPRHEESNDSSISYLPEVRAYLQFMEDDPSSRQRSHSFSGRNSSRSSSRRSSRRSSRHRPRSRSPSPYALERTAMASEESASNYSPVSSYGRYLTPQGSSDQGSFRSPESTPNNWLDASDIDPPSYQDCISQISRSNSYVKTSFI